MIKEVFISDHSHNIILGNPNINIQSPEYPIHEIHENRIIQLKVNDVILSFIYSDFDNFTATKLLLDIRCFIESKVTELSIKNVKNYYFTILELLININSCLPYLKSHLIDIMPSKNVYLDIVENIHTIISKDGIILKNAVEGNILSNSSIPATDFTIAKSNKYKILYSTNSQFKDHLNKIEIFSKGIESNKILMTYGINEAKTVIFTFKKAGAKYTFTCPQRSTFKFIEILIPVPKSTYSAILKPSSGTASLDTKNSTVNWSFEEYKFGTETIEVDLNMLEIMKDSRAISIKFNIPGWIESDIKMDKIAQAEGEEKKYWVHYTTQSGTYEIRQ